MVKKNKFKINGEVIHSETSADMVLFSDTNVAAVFNNISPFGHKILKCQSSNELNHLLEKPPKNPIFDETGADWNTTATFVPSDSSKSKFGSATGCNSYTSFRRNITLGNNPFTIQFWAYLNSVDDHTYFSLNGAFFLQGYTNSVALESSSGNLINLGNCAGKVANFEVGYKSGKIYGFVNGSLIGYQNLTVSRAVRALIFGGDAPFYIDELRIIDGRCLHTANFTKPSTPYGLTDDTVTLMHFEG